MGITLYKAIAHSGALSTGYYTTLDKAQKAIEQLYLDIGGNTFKCKQMEWSAQQRADGREPTFWLWVRKGDRSENSTPDEFLTDIIVKRIENDIDSPMPVV